MRSMLRVLVHQWRCIKVEELQEPQASRQEPLGRRRLPVRIHIDRMLIALPLFELGAHHPQLTFDFSHSDRPDDMVEEGID